VPSAHVGTGKKSIASDASTEKGVPALGFSDCLRGKVTDPDDPSILGARKDGDGMAAG
jgi:hypothetical protein